MGQTLNYIIVPPFGYGVKTNYPVQNYEHNHATFKENSVLDYNTAAGGNMN
jgi:hypothetical protein